MHLILITAKGRFVPKPGDNSGFEPLPTQVQGNSIFKKQCGDFLVYVTKCIPEADESLPQLDKHNYIAAILDVVELDAGNIAQLDKYLIAHDGDLLEKVGRCWHRNGIFSEDEFSRVNSMRGKDFLCNRFPNQHIYIFQHEPLYEMFSKVIRFVKSNLSEEHILAALEIIKNET